MIKYQIVTADSYRVIATGFKTIAGARAWADNHDYGQYENEGGLMIIQYYEE